MTVNIIIKIYDGIILASDSAGTMYAFTENVHTRNNMNKLFRLSKDHSIAIMMCGASHINNISIGNLIKDFNLENPICSTAIDIPEKIINDFSAYIKTKLDDYIKPIINNYLEGNSKSELETEENANRLICSNMITFYFAAYDNNSSSFRVWNFKTYSDMDDFVDLGDNDLFPVIEPEKLKNKTGWIGDGMHDPVDRLVNGYDNYLREALLSIVSDDKKESLDAILEEQHANGMVNPYMSIQDAIDLARFLAKMSAKTYYFLPQPDYVGGSIDIATITKHEGFKWIKRKLYYKLKYN